jgi:RND family efflux transporter MFP subunit
MLLSIAKCLFGIAILGSALACGPPNEPPQPRPPRVRVFEVSEESSGQARTVSGQLAAAKSSPLAFGVAGTVDSVKVDQGDAVDEGQVLATLDAEPLRMELERARSRLSANRATLVETERAYERASGLLSQRAVAQSEVEVAEANVKSARAALRGSQSQVEDAERDLRRAELRAPFSGTIAQRSIDPFQEIGANEAAFVLQGEGALVVKAQVAEAVIRNVDYAQPVRVTFPTSPDVELVGVVSLIAARAGAGNAFPVEVQLPDSEADLRPGMTARVTFNFAQYLEGRTAYLIPLSAIAIDVGLLAGKSDQDPEVPVFLFDEATGRARVRNIRVGDLRGNQLEVLEGLEPGDQVISAGVPFLHDGMEVRRWSRTSGLGGG